MLAKVPLVVGIFALIFVVLSLFGGSLPLVDTSGRVLNSLCWLGIAFGCLLALIGCGWVGERLHIADGPAAPAASIEGQSTNPT